jgi:hypothetical protein
MKALLDNYFLIAFAAAFDVLRVTTLLSFVTKFVRIQSFARRTPWHGKQQQQQQQQSMEAGDMRAASVVRTWV